MRTSNDRAAAWLTVSGLVGAAAGYWLPSAALVSETARRLFGVHARVPGQAVALTFDDGPHPQGSSRVLDILAREDVSATFFLAGEQVAANPSLAAEIRDAGHALGIHCYRHRNLMRLTPSQVRDDLDRAAAAIQSVTGVSSTVYRPPYGILTTPALLHARHRRWQPVLWRRDGKDWEHGATADAIARHLLVGLEPGDVLLLHDSDAYSAPGSWRASVAALPHVIDAIRRRELEFVSLGSLRRSV